MAGTAATSSFSDGFVTISVVRLLIFALAKASLVRLPFFLLASAVLTVAVHAADIPPNYATPDNLSNVIQRYLAAQQAQQEGCFRVVASGVKHLQRKVTTTEGFARVPPPFR